MHSAHRPLGKEQGDLKERGFGGMWIRGSAVFSVELAMILTSAVAVAGVMLGYNGDFLAYARNYRLKRRY
jgi:hypothetical protein